MQAVAALLLLAAVVVQGGGQLGLERLFRPSETVSTDCFEQAQPLMRSLHLSMHSHRHTVHEQCRREQQQLNVQQQNLLQRINASTQECLQMAHELEQDSPVAASELEASCHQAEGRIQQSLVSHANESARLHRLCSYRLGRVADHMRMASSALMGVLSECAPQHACMLFQMAKRKMNKMRQQVIAVGNEEVDAICALDGLRLNHDLRRTCERYELVKGVVQDASSAVFAPLHDTLENYCHESRVTTQLEEPTVPQVPEVVDTVPYGDDMEMMPELPESRVVTEIFDELPTDVAELPTLFDAVEDDDQILPEMPSLPFEPFFPPAGGDESTESPRIPFFPGIGPVVIDDTMQAGQEKDADKIEDAAKKFAGEVEDTGLIAAVPKEALSLEDSSSDDDEHDTPRRERHHHHRYTKLAIILGGVCVLVCAATAAIFTVILRRRRSNIIAHQPEKKTSAVRKVLLDDQDDADIHRIEQKGFENPTYNFFEGLQEEEA